MTRTGRVWAKLLLLLLLQQLPVLRVVILLRVVWGMRR
jgi:hypothetical protein